MKKARSDAKLLNLPEAQQAQLADWLLGGMPYHQAQALVEKEFGVKVSSLSGFAGFWREVCAPALVARRRKAVEAAEVMGSELSSGSGALDRATVDGIKQKAFELAIAPQSDPKDVKALFVLLQKAADQDLKNRQLALEERRVALLEKKAAQAEAAEGVVKDSTLTAEEQRKRIKEIFGMAA